MRPAGRPALNLLLAGLQDALKALFAQRTHALGRRRHLLQRRLLLGLELLCKIEEQVVLPALPAADPAWQQTVAPALRELELLRDTAMLAVQTISANREVSLSVLEGLTALHAARVRDLIERAAVLPVDWHALESEVRALLGRWRGEVEAENEIEDEDRDPVSLAPR